MAAADALPLGDRAPLGVPVADAVAGIAGGVELGETTAQMRVEWRRRRPEPRSQEAGTGGATDQRTPLVVVYAGSRYLVVALAMMAHWRVAEFHV